MLSEEARLRIKEMFAERRAGGPEPPLEQSRREWEEDALTVPLPRGARTTEIDAGGVPCEWMDMPRDDERRVLLLLHGGGYSAGSPRTHRKLAANLARFTGMRVLMPEYRLAPENPFPAAVKDVLVVYRWLVGPGGFTPADIVVAGDSAGGGLALSMLLALRDADAPMPRGAVLMSPWTDLSVSSPSYARMRKRDPCIVQKELEDAAHYYAGPRDLRDPLLSPLFAELGGLPPLLVHVGSEEIMLDDSRLLADRVRVAGGTVTYKVWTGLWHCFQHESPDIPEATQALVEIADFIAQQFDTQE